MSDQVQPPKVQLLKTVDPTTLARKDIPVMKWLVKDWIPWKYVTALYGDGGTGKSLLSQMLMTSASTGKLWLGEDVTKCRALGFFCEDNEDVLHIRQAAINAEMKLGFKDLGDMRWITRLGEDNVLMDFLREGRGTATEIYRRLLATALDFDAKLVVIDTAADTFGGNEIIRGQVRQFINLLGRLAKDIDGVVVLCAHPSLSGMSSGSGTGASTAWNNSVRSRLYLEHYTPQDDDLADEVDDLRVLTRKKSNYSSKGEDIKLRWQDGAFRAVLGPESEDTVARIERQVREKSADSDFLDGLQQLTKQNRNVSPAPTAHNYAPKLIRNLPGIDRKPRELEAAMERLFSANIIEVGVFGKDAHRKNKNGLILVNNAAEASEDNCGVVR